MKKPRGLEKLTELISSPDKPFVLPGEIWVAPEVLKAAGFSQGPEGMLQLASTLGASICFFHWARPLTLSDLVELSELAHGAGMGCGVSIDGPFQRLSQERDLLALLEELGKGPQGLRPLLTEETEKVAETIRLAEDSGTDLILICDDLAYSRSLYFSPAIFRELFIPFYSTLMRLISKKNLVFGWHSDGDVSPILADLVNCGFRFFSLESECVDLSNFKRTYGSRITLIGGIRTAWLTQEVPDLAKEMEYQEEIRTLAREGGLILASSCGLYDPKFLPTLKKIYGAVEKSKDFIG